MTPLLVLRSEIDYERWDELIAKSEQCVLYGFSWYLDIVCDDWKALIWPSVMDYQVVMPLPVKSKWGFQVLQQPLFCQYLGLFSSAEIPSELTFQFLKKLNTTFSYISSYHFHPENLRNLAATFPRLKAFQTTCKKTHFLALEPHFSVIQSNYSSDRRKNLKRSKLEKWQFAESDDVDPLIKLFRENHAEKISGGVSDRTYEIFRSISKTLISRSAVKLIYASKFQKIHAGIFIVQIGRHAIYLFNAADRTGREGNARTFLLNEYFSANAQSDIFFDFESPEISTIASFYTSFGAKKVEYFAIRKNSLPFPLNKIQDWRVAKSLKTIAAQSGDF